jgi:hypothetical protein
LEPELTTISGRSTTAGTDTGLTTIMRELAVAVEGAAVALSV